MRGPQSSSCRRGGNGDNACRPHDSRGLHTESFEGAGINAGHTETEKKNRRNRRTYTAVSGRKVRDMQVDWLAEEREWHADNRRRKRERSLCQYQRESS